MNSSLILGLVIGVIIGIVALAYGVYIIATVQSTMPSVNNEVANQTIVSIFNQGYNLFNLLLIVLLLTCVGAILLVLKLVAGGSAAAQ